MSELPPLPEQIMGVLGPIAVLLVEQPVDDRGKQSQGIWDSDKREIHVRIGLAPGAAWWTLYHEMTHSILDDVSVELRHKQEEDVCNAVALALTQHLSGHHVRFPIEP